MNMHAVNNDAKCIIEAKDTLHPYRDAQCNGTSTLPHAHAGSRYTQHRGYEQHRQGDCSPFDTRPSRPASDRMLLLAETRRAGAKHTPPSIRAPAQAHAVQADSGFGTQLVHAVNAHVSSFQGLLSGISCRHTRDARTIDAAGGIGCGGRPASKGSPPCSSHPPPLE